ncbi:glycosyltransferase family 39 protein [Caproiciproducens sp. LBM24188]
MKRKLKEQYHFIILGAILILSFGLNFYAISKNGTANEYYAACIKSMTQSVSNFFFVSFDPAGMVSVDKPPLGLWIQAIFVLIFGYHGWAFLLPQAIAGTLSCLMIYLLTAKYFGRPAGLISSLIFALSPSVVVISRNNTMDMQLIFVLLLATWFVFRSVDSGKVHYLLWAGVFVGLGFNIKMLQAYMILPAIAVTYLIFAKQKFRKRLLVGAAAVLLMLGVSFAWVAAVELTPASNRPYVDSTSRNSMLELITGHNGTERLFGSGMDGGFGAGQGDGGRAEGMPPQMNGGKAAQNGTPPQMQDGAVPQDGTPPQMPNDGSSSNLGLKSDRPDFSNRGDDGKSRSMDGREPFRGGGGMGNSEIGMASPLRLWNSNLFGQNSWLLLFALLGFCGCLSKAAFHKRESSQGVLLYWMLWLTAMAVFFSFAGFYHRYYLSMLAPAIAVLSGVGIVVMFRGFKRKKEQRKDYIRPVFLLAVLAANLGLEIRYLMNYNNLPAWVLPVTLAGAGIGLILMLFHHFGKKQMALYLSTAALTISLLAAPLYWSLTPVLYVPNATMPYAGPELSGNSGSRGFADRTNTSGNRGSSGLENYLVQNYKEGSFLVVSQRASDVAQFIIDTGLPCYAYGGFLGTDNSLSLEKLKLYVSEGKITYFFISSEMGGGSRNSEVINYVKENAVLIDESEYRSQVSSNVQRPGMGGMTKGSLYKFG